MLRECLDTLQSHEVPYLINTKNASVRFSGQCERNLRIYIRTLMVLSSELE